MTQSGMEITRLVIDSSVDSDALITMDGLLRIGGYRIGSAGRAVNFKLGPNINAKFLFDESGYDLYISVAWQETPLPHIKTIGQFISLHEALTGHRRPT